MDYTNVEWTKITKTSRRNTPLLCKQFSNNYVRTIQYWRWRLAYGDTEWVDRDLESVTRGRDVVYVRYSVADSRHRQVPDDRADGRVMCTTGNVQVSATISIFVSNFYCLHFVTFCILTQILLYQKAFVIYFHGNVVIPTLNHVPCLDRFLVNPYCWSWQIGFMLKWRSIWVTISLSNT